MKYFVTQTASSPEGIYLTRRAARLSLDGNEGDPEARYIDVIETYGEGLGFVVWEYYKLRGLKEPNGTEALLWLISELGELCAVYMASYSATLSNNERALFSAISVYGEDAEEIVASKGGWIRNRSREVDKGDELSCKLRDEIGDVLMMLTKFAMEFGIDPVEAMLSKMEKKAKGFRD